MRMSFPARICNMEGGAQAMVRDPKLNRMLLPAGKLRRMIAAFQEHGEMGGVDFRVPTKRLW